VQYFRWAAAAGESTLARSEAICRVAAIKGTREDRLDDLLDLGVVILLSVTHAILDNIIQIIAPAQIIRNSKTPSARG